MPYVTQMAQPGQQPIMIQQQPQVISYGQQSQILPAVQQPQPQVVHVQQQPQMRQQPSVIHQGPMGAPGAPQPAESVAPRDPHIPLAKCRVLYLGSAVPIETAVGIGAVQHPCKERYVLNSNGDVPGIDAWLFVYSSGIRMTYVQDTSVSTWFPIPTLHVCAAVKPVNTHNEKGERQTKFVALDSEEGDHSPHPPMFACITRRTQGVKVLECHVFICKSNTSAMALVHSCSHAYDHKEGWTDQEPPSERPKGDAEMRLVPAEPVNKDDAPPEFFKKPPPHGYFYTTDKSVIRRFNVLNETPASPSMVGAGMMPMPQQQQPQMPAPMVDPYTMQMYPGPDPMMMPVMDPWMDPMMMQPVAVEPVFMDQVVMAPQMGMDPMMAMDPMMMQPQVAMDPLIMQPQMAMDPMMMPPPPMPIQQDFPQPPGAPPQMPPQPYLPPPPQGYFMNWDQNANQGPVMVFDELPQEEVYGYIKKNRGRRRRDRRNYRDPSPHYRSDDSESYDDYDDYGEDDRRDSDYRRRDEYRRRDYYEEEEEEQRPRKEIEYRPSSPKPKRDDYRPREEYSRRIPEDDIRDEPRPERRRSDERDYRREVQYARVERRQEPRQQRPEPRVEPRVRQARPEPRPEPRYERQEYEPSEYSEDSYYNRGDKRPAKAYPDRFPASYRRRGGENDDLILFHDYYGNGDYAAYESQFNPEITLKRSSRHKRDDPYYDAREANRYPRNDREFGNSIIEERRTIGDTGYGGPSAYDINDYRNRIERDDDYGYHGQIENQDKKRGSEFKQMHQGLGFIP